MGDALAHLPQQRSVSWVSPEDSICLGRVSNGILNLEPQPVFSQDGSLAIVMVGEIFGCENHRRQLLRETPDSRTLADAEFLLRLYEETGTRHLAQINGSFNFAIWDKRKSKLVLANDRFGVRPLYYSSISNRLLFSSEAKGILRCPGFNAELEPAALPELFAFGHLLGERTLFRGISLLLPASVLEFGPDGLGQKQYWRMYEHVQPSSNRPNDVLAEVKDAFKEAISRQQSGPTNVAISLTGGVDSRAIIAASDYNSNRIFSFTHGEKGATDITLAQRITNLTTKERHRTFCHDDEFHCQFQHMAHDTVYLSDGMAGLIHVATVYPRQLMAAEAKIELQGSGAYLMTTKQVKAKVGRIAEKVLRIWGKAALRAPRSH